jgi:acylphosphatase
MQRLSIWYSGRVQGVGFRMTCATLANNFRVTGRICNLTDGRVEMIAEGEKAELESFRDRIAIEMQRNITDWVQHWSPATGEWTDFRVATDKHA